MNNQRVLKYDTPIEVSESEYNELIVKCAGVIAHRVDNGKFFIKVLLMPWIKEVKAILKIK